MPVEPPEVKGLLPGRGPAGRAPPGRGARSPAPPGRGARSGRPPSRWPAGPGRAPLGRGPGVAPGRGAAGRSVAGRSAAGRSVAGAENSAAGTGVTGAGLAGAAGAGFGPGRGPGVGAAWDGLGAAASAAGLGAAGRGAPGVGAPGLGAADLRGAAGFAPGLPAPPGPCSASVSLRTTGASIVEDAERTNSPSSWSLAMTTLLSTPNSLASSYTRTLATSLLLGPGCPPDRRYFMGVLIAYSSSAHRNLDLLPTREVPDRTVTRAVLLTVGPYPADAGPNYCCSICSMYRRSSAVSSGPGLFKALGNARRRTARSRQTSVGCTEAPRPGSVPRGSGTQAPSTITIRSRSPLAARSRHPTQVRSGHARACVRPDTLQSTSPRPPHPWGAVIGHVCVSATMPGPAQAGPGVVNVIRLDRIPGRAAQCPGGCRCATR